MDQLNNVLIENAYNNLTHSVASQDMLPLQRISELREIRSKYGSRQQLMATFAVDQQAAHTATHRLHRCFMGTAPTLVDVDQAFGEGTGEEWLTYQLAELSEFCGVQTKMLPGQLMRLASIIRNGYYDLKLTELEVFFSWFKLGRYGRFFGAVDPLVITTALREFRRERDRIHEGYEREEARRRREAALSSPTAMTREEYDERFILRPFLARLAAQRNPPTHYFRVDEDWSELKGRQRAMPKLWEHDERFTKVMNEKDSFTRIIM